MRPKKTRRVKCSPVRRCFIPGKIKAAGAHGIKVSIDEFEAIRLADLEGLTHAVAAKSMNVSRPTFTRILGVARGKVAKALVDVTAIRIEGGCCHFGGKTR